MKVILGIGNPGRKYAETRHNAGFRIVDTLAERLGETVGRRRFGALWGEARIGDDKVMLVKPQNYVNNSGEAAASALGYYRLEPSEMLVVADEAALPMGKIRFNRSGSSAGHRGLESVIAHVGDGFHRLRVGIGSSEGDMVGHVLGRAGAADREWSDKIEAVAVTACEEWVREGMDECMNRYNGMTIDPPEGAFPEEGPQGQKAD